MAYEFIKNGKAADTGCSGSPNSKTSRCRLSSDGDAYGVIRLADVGLLKSVSNPNTLISILYFHSPWTRTAHDLFVTRLINATWKVKGQWSKLIATAKWSRSSVYVRQAIVTSPCYRRVTVSACIVCCWVVAMGSCFVPAVWVAAFHRILFPSCYMLLCSVWRSLLAIGWYFLFDVVS